MSGFSRRDALKLGMLGVAGVASLDLIAGCSSGSAAPTGTDKLTPFTPGSGGGSSTGLAERVAWAPTADSEFFLALGAGMKEAARLRGVDYVTATSGNNPSRHVAQMESFLTRGVGAFAMQPLNADADTPVLRKAIEQGVCVQGIITAPSTVQVAASQYQIGFDQGKAAADYVKANLGGEGKALYFNLDTVAPALKVRHDGVLAGLKSGGGGIEVVGDLTVADISTRSGFNTMMSALQAHRDIKVVLGGDTIVVGAYKALKEAKALTDDMFLSGVDGDKDALALVKEGGAYKLSIAFAWELMGYGLGQFGADWIEGKKVPRVVVAKGVQLDSPQAVTAFQTASADPAAVFADPSRYNEYLPLYGSVSYASRDTFWSEAVDPPGIKGATPSP